MIGCGRAVIRGLAGMVMGWQAGAMMSDDTSGGAVVAMVRFPLAPCPGLDHRLVPCRSDLIQNVEEIHEQALGSDPAGLGGSRELPRPGTSPTVLRLRATSR